MITVRHAHPVAGRQSAFGVDFIDGVGQVDELHPERELALTQHGFTVEKSSPYADFTVKELRELAKIEGLDVPKGATKQALVDAFTRAELG